MALIVEDGTGLATAESYTSVAYADAYHVKFTGSAEWAAATEADKERHLRLGTQFLDLEYHNSWRGTRTNEGQALDWPRENVTDDDDYDLDDDELPTVLLYATAEAGLRSYLGDDLLGIETDGDVIQESSKLGPLEDSYTYANPKPLHTKYPKIVKMLKSITKPFSIDRA